MRERDKEAYNKNFFNRIEIGFPGLKILRKVMN